MKKVQVSLFVRGGLKATLACGGAAETVYVWASSGIFYFRAMDDSEYELAGGLLEVVCGHVRLTASEVVAALGVDVAAARIAAIAGRSGGVMLRHLSWMKVFHELPVSRAVSMAVADSRLVPHLSPEAAALYAAEHSDLVESGHML